MVLFILVGIERKIIPGSTGRFLRYGIIALALLFTLGLNLYTLFQVARARTSVPWADQWAFIDELARHGRGEPLWTILWSPYWGHRLVIPRLLFLADARWFSLASLTWLTMLLQLAHVALLIVLAWLLLGRRSVALFMIAATVILNLMLSPFQMENFVWGMQTMFPLVFVAATGAFLCLPQSGAPFLALCFALGIVSSYTMPNGVLVWFVLLAQAIYLRRNRKVVIAFAVIGAAVIASYLWHYTRPLEMGMGAGGILRHPIDAIKLLGMILGSPFRFTLPEDAAVGVLALAITGYIFIRALFSRRQDRKWFSALFAIILFLFLSSLSIVAGRLTPKDLDFPSRDFIPGRYFTMICLFWASIALLALSTFERRRLHAVLLCVYGVLFACLMFTSVIRQLTEAEDWADFFLGTDAVGTALLLDVPDEQLLSVLWPSKPERDERNLFLRQHRLAMFHEPRAAFLGKRLSDLFPSPAGQCAGAVEKTVDLDGSSWRVTGWAWSTESSRPPDDILFTDATGRIIGLARGGLRHGYFPGFLIDPQPAPHSQFRHSEWLGYMKGSEVGLYGLFRNQGTVCTVK